MRRLAKYQQMRRLDVTPEPSGLEKPAARCGARERLRYVIQLHHARRRHFDFRLELGGTLRSWAVPKGPSRDPAQKRLAVEVEDHPIAYGDFEGDIPAGQYGAGHVDIWDRGWWEPEDADADAAIRKGHLRFTLHGERLQGRWSLVRTHLAGRQPQWLLIKSDDEHVQVPDVADDVVLREWRARQGGARCGRSAAASARTARVAAKAGGTRERSRADPPRDPFPQQVVLQLARSSARAPGGAERVHEIKYDGYRFLAMREGRRLRIVPRNGLDWIAKLPAVKDAILALPCRDCILDGELIAFDDSGRSRFDLLQQRFGEGGELRAVVFDLLYLDGRDLRGEAQDTRKAALQRLLDGAPLPLQLSEYLVGDGPEAARAACRLGFEGIVSKSRLAPYRESRGGARLKIKRVQSGEFVIVGYTAGRGQPWRYVGHVGSGISDALLAELRASLRPARTSVELANPPGRVEPGGAHAIWVRPERIVEVEFRAWSDDGLLHQASLKGLCPDKSPADVANPDRAPQVETVAASGRRAARAGPGARKAAAGATSRAARAAKSGGRTRGKPTRAAARRASVPTARARRKAGDPPDPYPFTHPERQVFTDPPVTKAEIGALYTDIAAQILPGIVDRPLALLRCPDGIGGEYFFQKRLTPGFRASVHAARAKADRDPYVYIEDLDGLLALVQMNVVEIHAWGAPLAHPDTPDRIVFDLDPAPDVAWSEVRAAALAMRERLSALRLESFVRATGGKGLHVVVPLTGDDGWDAAKSFAHALASTLAQEAPQRYVDVASKARRGGRIFVDYLRNVRGATTIASYSLRARPGAPLAVPLGWDELPKLRSAAQYHIGNIRERIAKRPEPWAAIDDVEQALPLH